MAKNGYKGITRIDANSTHAWQVRIFFQGRAYSRMFSDKKWGGRAKALAQALAYRDTLNQELGRPSTERRIVTQSPNNKTGVIGVRRTRKATGWISPDGQPLYSEVYEVCWPSAAGKINRTTFSIRKYGEQEAFQRACALRQEKERLLFGRSLTAPLPKPQYPEHGTQSESIEPTESKNAESIPKHGNQTETAELAETKAAATIPTPQPQQETATTTETTETTESKNTESIPKHGNQTETAEHTEHAETKATATIPTPQPQTAKKPRSRHAAPSPPPPPPPQTIVLPLVEVFVRRTIEPTGLRDEHGFLLYEECYEVYCDPPQHGEPNEIVSITEYGEKAALQRACTLRAAKEAALARKTP